MILPVQVTFRNMPLDERLEREIRNQARKLERFYDRITSCRVIVEPQGGRRRGNLCHVRIGLGLPQGELIVKHQPSLRAAAQDQEGERIRKKADIGAEHKNKSRAVHDAFAEMRRRLQDYARKQRLDTKTRSEPAASAKVVELRAAEGYGFAKADDGRQVYFHRNSVLAGHFGRLRIGSRVKIAIEMGEKGLQASTLRLARPAMQAKAAAASVVARPKSPEGALTGSQKISDADYRRARSKGPSQRRPARQRRGPAMAGTGVKAV